MCTIDLLCTMFKILFLVSFFLPSLNKVDGSMN